MINEGVKLVGTSGNDEINTPDNLYNWLNRRFLFNYDAFASTDNTKIQHHYSTSEGTYHNQELVSTETGLTYSWQGLRVFCNPPYSRGLISDSVDKMVAEKNDADIIVTLIKVDTSTAWWRKLAVNAHIEYLSRVKYAYPDGRKSQAATFSSAIAILQPNIDAYKESHN